MSKQIILPLCCVCSLMLLAVFATSSIGGAAWAAASALEQASFATADQAVEALIDAVRSGNGAKVAALLGSRSQAVVEAIAAPTDPTDRAKFVAAYDQHHALTGNGGVMTLLVGPGAWPFPVPLHHAATGWSFDGRAGQDEMLARVIGEYEIAAQRVCAAIADAERDYAAAERDGRTVRAYAAQLNSSPGHQDGLYWPAKEGQPKSPLGPLLADSSMPYHGYTFRILTAQGPHAPGGAYDYMVRGDLLGGFAVLASPALYGLTGIKTFLLAFDGSLYEKDLGPNTTEIAARIKRFDPDASWEQIEPP
jgi:hypothetical protein